MGLHLHDWEYLDRYSRPEGLQQAKRCRKCGRVRWVDTRCF